MNIRMGITELIFFFVGGAGGGGGGGGGGINSQLSLNPLWQGQ